MYCLFQVDHLDELLKLKEERIEELQKQLERKQTRRKEVEALQNSLAVPFEPEPPTPHVQDLITIQSKTSFKNFESITKIPTFDESKIPKIPEFKKSEESKIPVPKLDTIKSSSKPSITEVTSKDLMSIKNNIDRVNSDVFKEVEIVDERFGDRFHDTNECIGEPEALTIEDTIQKEVKNIYQANFQDLGDVNIVQ